MTPAKLVVVIVLLAIIVVGGHDALRIAKADKNVRNTANAAALAAAQSIGKTHDTKTAATDADAVAAQAHDIVTKYTYDPVAAKVSLTVSGSTTTWVTGRIDKSLADNITASASARPTG
jgi:hypothetical protein